jgi:isopenicillin-N N-acyltransferase like protein
MQNKYPAVRDSMRFIMKRFLCFLILFVFSVAVWALDLRTNENPILSEPPRLLKEIPNGRLEIAGQGDDAVQVLHLWGAPREMGRTMGVLLKEQIRAYCSLVIGLMTQSMEQDVSVLDQTFETAKPFIPQHILEEMEGIAEGAEIDRQTILRVNTIGEVSEWHCSLFAAWGAATASTGSLLQLRALDYAVEAEIQRYPVIVVYHPDRGHAFANFSWSGVVGAVTGMSSIPLGISEIGDDYHKESDSFAGYPFMFMLRDILQFDKSLEEAIARVKRGPRTSSLMYAIGDGVRGEGRALQTSRIACNVYDPDNLEPLTPTHPRIADVVYWGMSWNVPKYDRALHDMLVKHYGNLTAEATIREILPTVGTGNLQVAIYDLTRQIAWTSNARANSESGPLNAYERSFIRLDMKALFAEAQPNQ